MYRRKEKFRSGISRSTVRFGSKVVVGESERSCWTVNGGASSGKVNRVEMFSKVQPTSVMRPKSLFWRIGRRIDLLFIQMGVSLMVTMILHEKELCLRK